MNGLVKNGLFIDHRGGGDPNLFSLLIISFNY
jgi:hypothetical protein